jgi:hypothetical protein
MQIVITQNIKDFVGSEEIARKSTAIINACQYSFIFALSPNDIEDLCKLYEKAGGINESEQEQITTAPRGQTFAIMSPSSRTTFQIEVPDGVVQMFKQPEYISQYFVGEEGEKYWEDFVGSSRLVRLENKMNMLDDETLEEPLPERKTISFVELTEEEIQAEAKKEHTVVLEEAAPAVAQEEPRVEPVQPQVIHTVVQTAPTGDETAQQLAKILGDFSFEAIRSEINHRFEALRRDLEETAMAPVNKQEEASTVPAAKQEETDESATTATFRIETAKIPAPVQEQAPVSEKTDYSDLIIPDEADADDTEDEDAGGIDIMALLSAQAKKMENISTIEMMEMYGEAFSEITLEELEKYINKNHK